MPILHFRLKSNDESINIGRPLHAQQFTLRRAVVVLQSTGATSFDGGVRVDVSFFNGFEILSNEVQNLLYIPFDTTATVIDKRFEFSFNAEDVQDAFQVRTRNMGSNAAADFDSATGIKYIDLFFEFTELYNYLQY